YYDPKLDININETIPEYVLYNDTDETGNDINVKIKFYILVKLFDKEIMEKHINIYNIGMKSNFNLVYILNFLKNRNFNFDKINIKKIFREKYIKYKNDYIETKLLYEQEHITIKKIINGNKILFSRAGVVLIEKFNNNLGRNEPAIILFNDVNWNTYVEPGGR